MAWQRLASDREAANTLVATGGQRQDRGFLYPLLDHCVRARRPDKCMASRPWSFIDECACVGSGAALCRIIDRTRRFHGLRLACMSAVAAAAWQRDVMTPTEVITDRDAMRKAPPESADQLKMWTTC